MTGHRQLVIRLATAVLGLALLSAAAPAVADAHPAAGSLVVHTDKGKISGARSDGVDSFLGVPYAAPPVGALRWRPPQPPAAWTGVRAATQYGDRCAALASTNGARSDSEDCLFLNVQRPTGVAAGRRLPVYVFIHGGGLVNGSSNQAGGDKIVRETNAVVVSMNYRLGVFGFLGLPGLSHAGEGNYGFLDQQAALRWVQRNIAAFGGDPRQVTLGGESAGAFSVCAHLVARSSRGLFARAMMQSGSCTDRPLADTEAASAGYATTRRRRLLAVVDQRHRRVAGARRDRGRTRPVRPRADRQRLEPRRGPHVRPGLHRLDREPIRQLGADHLRR
jgi:carboxylesterase type B